MSHSLSMPTPSRLPLLALTLAAAALTGCGMGPAATIQTTDATAISGTLHGGQQPVSGATVQLIAPGLTGYGSAGTVLTSTISRSDGSFTLPRPYTCPASSSLVYLQATGGNAGAGTNTAIGLAAIVGNCSSLQATDFFVVNEVTTIAAAFALAPFATVASGATAIGTSSTNLQGLVNTGSTAASLADVRTGNARATNALTDVVLPTAEVNTLANILAACVNAGTTNNPTNACTNLFSLATPTGGAAPTDTLQAAVDIALNPGLNTASLFALSSSTPPFQPTLTSAPNDFALGIQFTSASITASYAGPAGIDIDASGNAWVAIYSSNGITLQELSPTAQYPLGSSGTIIAGAQGPTDLAVTPAGNIEVASTNSVIYQVTPFGGTPGGFTTSSASSLSVPFGLAVDNHDGSTWAANTGSAKATRITTTGAQATGSPYTAGPYPYGIAVAGTGDVWVADSDQYDSGNPGSALTKLTRASDGSYTAANYSTGAGTNPFAVAIDNTGNIWSTLANGVGRYSSTGTVLSPVNGYQLDSTDALHTSAQGIQIDGLGRAIVSYGPSGSNSGFGNIGIFAPSGTHLSKSAAGYGYTANGTIPNYTMTPKCLAIDGSGNVWISGQSATGHLGYGVVEIIGIAAPVLTPLSTATSPNHLASRP